MPDIAQNIIALVGNPGLSEDQATQAVSIVTSIAKAYTRGVGFVGDEPNGEIGAVITLAAVRLLSNPAQISHRNRLGAIEVDWRGGFDGWTLGERATLNRYRETAR